MMHLRSGGTVGPDINGWLGGWGGAMNMPYKIRGSELGWGHAKLFLLT